MTGACIHFLFFNLEIPALTRRGFLLTCFLIFCIVYLALALLSSCYYRRPVTEFYLHFRASSFIYYTFWYKLSQFIQYAR